MSNRKLIAKLDNELDLYDDLETEMDEHKLEKIFNDSERYKGEVRKYDPPTEGSDGR